MPHNNLPQFHTATAMIKVRGKVSIIITIKGPYKKEVVGGVQSTAKILAKIREITHLPQRIKILRFFSNEVAYESNSVIQNTLNSGPVAHPKF